MTHHAAANTQIRARAITARRLDDEDGLSELHVFHLAVSELDCAGVDVSGRTFDATGANRETRARNVNAANLGAGSVGSTNLYFFNDNTRDTVTTDDVNVICSDPIYLGAGCQDRPGFHFRGCCGRDFVLAAQTQIRRGQSVCSRA